MGQEPVSLRREIESCQRPWSRLLAAWREKLRLVGGVGLDSFERSLQVLATGEALSQGAHDPLPLPLGDEPGISRISGTNFGDSIFYSRCQAPAWAENCTAGQDPPWHRGLHGPSGVVHCHAPYRFDVGLHGWASQPWHTCLSDCYLFLQFCRFVDGVNEFLQGDGLVHV